MTNSIWQYLGLSPRAFGAKVDDPPPMIERVDMTPGEKRANEKARVEKSWNDLRAELKTRPPKAQVDGLYVIDDEGDAVCRHCSGSYNFGHFPGCQYERDRDTDRVVIDLRARVAELESMNKMLCGKLDDQRRALWDPCQPYLKDGETPAECIARNRRDVDIALSSLARDRARVAELESAALAVLGCNDRCCIQSPQCWAQCQADAKLRAVLSAGAVPE